MIHVQFKHGFNLTKLKLGPIWLNDVTQRVADLIDHLSNAFVCENVVRIFDVVSM